MTVKSITGIKSCYAIWFSPVNCPRGFSSLSCDNNNNNKLRCMELLRIIRYEKGFKKPRLGRKKLECVFADMCSVWSLTSICWAGQFNSTHLKK